LLRLSQIKVSTVSHVPDAEHRQRRHSAVLWQEQNAKVAFWHTKDFYGLDLSTLAEAASHDHFAQPVVGYVDPASLLCTSTAELTIDFGRDSPESLHVLEMPFDFVITQTGVCHGLAAWFDVSFMGSDVTTVLSTAPAAPGTHWYQCRLLLREPIAVNAMQRIKGTLQMVANARYSYNLVLTMAIAGSEASTADGRPISSSVAISLQDQMYHYLNASGYNAAT
jgi:histone-arginine methyltransferase CARM1